MVNTANDAEKGYSSNLPGQVSDATGDVLIWSPAILQKGTDLLKFHILFVTQTSQMSGHLK